MHHSETHDRTGCSIEKLHKNQSINRRKLYENFNGFARMPGGPVCRIVAIFAALGWGLWWFPLRHLATLDMPMVQVNAGLMGLGAMMLTPLMLVPGLRNGLWHWATLVSGGLLGVSLVFWHHALVEGDVLAAAVLFYLSPVWGGMIGRVFFGDGFNPRPAAGGISGLYRRCCHAGAGSAAYGRRAEIPSAGPFCRCRVCPVRRGGADGARRLVPPVSGLPWHWGRWHCCRSGAVLTCRLKVLRFSLYCWFCPARHWWGCAWCCRCNWRPGKWCAPGAGTGFCRHC